VPGTYKLCTMHPRRVVEDAPVGLGCAVCSQHHAGGRGAARRGRERASAPHEPGVAGAVRELAVALQLELQHIPHVSPPLRHPPTPISRIVARAESTHLTRKFRCTGVVVPRGGWRPCVGVSEGPYGSCVTLPLSLSLYLSLSLALSRHTSRWLAAVCGCAGEARSRSGGVGVSDGDGALSELIFRAARASRSSSSAAVIPPHAPTPPHVS
jgi:hypothetical protein